MYISVGGGIDVVAIVVCCCWCRYFVVAGIVDVCVVVIIICVVVVVICVVIICIVVDVMVGFGARVYVDTVVAVYFDVVVVDVTDYCGVVVICVYTFMHNVGTLVVYVGVVVA